MEIQSKRSSNFGDQLHQIPGQHQQRDGVIRENRAHQTLGTQPNPSGGERSNPRARGPEIRAR